MAQFTKQKITDLVSKIIAEELLTDAEDVMEDVTFESMGGDSLDQVEIVSALEEEFNIDISDEDAENIQTFRQAIDYVSRKVRK